MDSLKDIYPASEQIDYNAEPVYYCKQCLSLRIKSMGNLNYCEDCTGTETSTCHIDEWQEMHKEKYNKLNLE